MKGVFSYQTYLTVTEMFASLTGQYDIYRSKNDKIVFLEKAGSPVSGSTLNDETVSLLSEIFEDFIKAYPVKVTGKVEGPDDDSLRITDLSIDSSSTKFDTEAIINLGANLGKFKDFQTKYYKNKYSLVNDSLSVTKDNLEVLEEKELKKKENAQNWQKGSIPKHKQKTIETKIAVKRFLIETYGDDFLNKKASYLRRQIKIKAKPVAKIIVKNSGESDELKGHKFSYLKDIINPMNKNGDLVSRKECRGEVFTDDYLDRIIRKLQKAHK